ncbi:uncharacterized protein UHOD_06716 [Ustilago sp. UG-2017b]|nr:uncharacterized protein UHOD_06716 [Ustilago sp. UG-2017b]
MNPCASGRDGFSRDVPSWPSADRRRSRSPPPTRLHRDHDGPAKTLPRKPVAATNTIPLGATVDAHSHNHASTSSSSSTYDGSSTYARHPPMERSKPIVPRRPSNAADPRSKIVSRLAGSPSERNLFEQIEIKRWSISEDRKELSDLVKKVKSLEDYLNKSGSKDTKNLEKLTSHQQQQQRLQQKIKVDNDELHRMSIDWQYDITKHFFPTLLAAATVPIEANIDELRSRTKADREDEQKRYDGIESKARIAYAETNRLKSDIAKIAKDASGAIRDGDRLRQDYTDFSKQLRRDVDKDVKQIMDNQRRITQIEKDVATLQARAGAQPSLAQQALGASTSAAANSTAPSRLSSASTSRSRAASPPQDPHIRPAPRPEASDAASTPASTSTSAPARTTETSTATATTATRPATPSAPVTQAQFRKWERDFHQNIELRLEEVKDMAVGEAAFENDARMDDRLRALARRWKEKATRGEHLSGQSAAEGSGATVADAVIGSIDALAAVAPQGVASSASEPTPMDVETNAAEDRLASTTNGPNCAQATQGASASTSQDRPKSPVRTHSASDVIDVSTPPEATSQPNETAATATSTTAVSATAATAEPKTNEDAAAATQQPFSDATDANANAAAAATVVLPAAVLKQMRTLLKDHARQMEELKHEVERLRTSKSTSLDELLNAPDKLKQLAAALKVNGLDIPAAIGALATQLEVVINGMRAEFADVRAPQQNLADQVTTLETWRAEFIGTVDERVQWLQKQLEVLDDQSSLQGALLVKLAEHANPRRQPAAPATPTVGAVQAAAATNTRSPLVAHANPQAQQQQQLQQRPHQPQPQQHGGNSPSLIMRAAAQALPQQQQHRPSGDVAAGALSAHMHQLLQQPQIQSPQVQQLVHQQMQQPLPQPLPQQQQQQSLVYNMPRQQPPGQYQYQDPNQRRGHP